MKKIYFFFALLLSGNIINAQTFFCDTTSNVVIFSNYDGGVLNINVDQNIPNLKIGICSYEASQINISGTYAANVTKVWYAGYNGTNDNCNLGVTNTTISGVPNSVDTITIYPPATMNDPNGWSNMICGYQCDSTTNQGGCNTAEQIVHFFLTKFGGSLRYHRIQYSCWPSQTANISMGGNCCIVPLTLSASQSVAPLTTIKAYPNPADEILTIEWNAISSPTMVQLLDLSGRLIKENAVSVTDGSNRFAISTAGLATGTYFVKVFSNEGIRTERIEIVH
jgi:hypothetical protein